ncbi:MAG: MASE1 domain-containing protein, partial [Spirochaetaceae bacterium]|nr:MASE1 domain-containing protein [Spirochaetaceae bacterium]
PILAVAGSAADLAFHLLDGNPPGTAALFCLASAIEALASAAIIRLVLKGSPSYRSQREFMVVAAFASATIPLSASIKAAVAAAGFVGAGFAKAWVEFAVADIIGALLIAPAFVAWIAHRDRVLRSAGRLSIRRIAEIAALLLLFALVAWELCQRESDRFVYREFLVVPIVLWSALRFGTRGATFANFSCAVLVLATSAAAGGRSVVEPIGSVATYLSIQAFIGLIALIGALIGEGIDGWRDSSEALAASEKRYRDIFESSPLGIMHTSFDGRLVSCNRRLAELFGYDSKEDLEKAMAGSRVQGLLYADPSERDRRMEALQDPGKGWVVHENHYVRKDGSSFVGRAFFRQLTTSEHGADIEGIIEDRSALFATEERLKAALAEKDLLFAELEHRVKNNLNVVASLISLGASELEEGPSKKILVEAQTRIRSMSLIYEQLYKGRASGKVTLKTYVEKLSRALVETYAQAGDKVLLELEIDDWELDIKRAVPLGLIVNELLANALKYAFRGDGDGHG